MMTLRFIMHVQHTCSKSGGHMYLAIVVYTIIVFTSAYFV